MSRRIDVELTSDRGDGTLTWRAAGAKAPKGVLDATLLPTGVKVGDTVKADADYDMEGVTIVAVMAPTEKKKSPDVIEFIGAPPPPPGTTRRSPSVGSASPVGAIEMAAVGRVAAVAVAVRVGPADRARPAVAGNASPTTVRSVPASSGPRSPSCPRSPRRLASGPGASTARPSWPSCPRSSARSPSRS